MPLTVSWTHRHVRTSYLPARHDDVEIQYVRHGMGWYFIDGAACAFRSNMLLVVNPGEVHHLVMGKLALLNKCCVMLNPAAFEEEIRPAAPLAELPRPLKLGAADSAQVEWTLQQLSAECQADLYGRGEMIRILLRRFFLLAARTAQSDHQPERRGAGDPPLLLDMLIDYLERHFRRDIAGLELRRQFGYSPDYLSRLMRRHTGCGFKHYVMERRIAEAKLLLRNEPQLKISAVAEAVGFKSFPLFNRIFKHAAGMTALEWRARK